MSRKLLFVLSLIATGCAYAQAGNNNDPYQDFNRHMYAFNDGLDKVIFRPIALVYQTVTPSPVRTSVTNFFNNLDMIPTIINDGLQGNGYNMGRDTWRFLINTTLGIGGLFDVAKHMNLPAHHEDFGLTLAHWGYENSTYLVLPFLGPSTIRDTAGIPADYASNIYPYVDDSVSYSLNGLDMINGRANLLNYDNVLVQAFDPYTAVKNGYLQKRQGQIKKD